MASRNDTQIKMSRWSFWYFFGYYFWGKLKRFILVVLLGSAAYGGYHLIRNGQALGIGDDELLRTLARPLPRVLLGFVIVVAVYSLIAALVDQLNTHYSAGPHGLVVETGWWTKHITVVSYSHIQKMTIVANPFDRLLGATAIEIDLVGASKQTVSLEGVDIEFAKQFQTKIARRTQSRLPATRSRRLLTKPASSKTE